MTDADVNLQIGPEGDPSLALAVEIDEELHVLATADAGRLELYSDES